MSGHAQHVQVAVTDLEPEQHVQPPQRQRDMEEVDRELLDAWVRNNWRQLVSVCRDGAGGIR